MTCVYITTSELNIRFIRWNFLTLDRFHLPLYVFYLFDTNKTKTLNREIVGSLVETIHEADLGSKPELVELVNDLCYNSKSLSSKQFSEYCSVHHEVCAPLLELQTKLRQKVVGEFFWKDCMERRSGYSEQLKMDYVEILHERITQKKARYAGGGTGVPIKKKKMKKEDDAQLKKQNSIMAGFENMRKQMSQDEPVKKGKITGRK